MLAWCGSASLVCTRYVLTLLSLAACCKVPDADRVVISSRDDVILIEERKSSDSLLVSEGNGEALLARGLQIPHDDLLVDRAGSHVLQHNKHQTPSQINNKQQKQKMQIEFPRQMATMQGS